jgi:hypothetical protein
VGSVLNVNPRFGKTKIRKQKFGGSLPLLRTRCLLEAGTAVANGCNLSHLRNAIVVDEPASP